MAAASSPVGRGTPRYRNGSTGSCASAATGWPATGSQARAEAAFDEPQFRGYRLAWLTRALLAWTALSGLAPALASVPDTRSAAVLQARYASLGEQLQRNPFRRALVLDSAESASSLKGDVHAVVDYPFATVSAALRDANDWCDVLILHINTKYCQAATDKGGTALRVSVGRKTAQALEDAHPIAFAYRVAAATPEYLEVRLDAPEGPLSTRNYRIQLQAVPIENDRTFLHLTYSYDYGMAGRLAMKTYLATIGSGKVGFTRTGRQPDGQPEHIGGMRGVVERNTMRYYLAIDAYLEALSTPERQRFQKRLESWFAATEQYPRQLREVERTAYFDMKRSEYRRQRRGD